MKYLKIIFIIKLLSLCTAGLMSYSAQAADLGIIEEEPLKPTAYVIVRGGATFPEDTDFDIDLSGGPIGVNNEYEDAGFMVSGALGISLSKWLGTSGFRGEIELGYLENEIDAHNVEGIGKFTGGDAFGDTSVFFGLASIYYDFDVNLPIKPFIGAGGGFGHVEFDGHGVSAANPVLDDDDTGFAWHASAGVTAHFSENVAVEIGYRYLSVVDVDLESEDGTESSVDIDNHIVYGGLKYSF